MRPNIVENVHNCSAHVFICVRGKGEVKAGELEVEEMREEEKKDACLPGSCLMIPVRIWELRVLLGESECFLFLAW